MTKLMDTIGQIIFYIALYVSINFVTPLILNLIGQESTIINQVIFGSIVFSLIVMVINREKLTKKGWFTSFSKKELYRTLELSLASVILVNFFLVYLFPDFITNYMPEVIKQSLDTITRESPFVIILSVGFLAPFVEEILFRGAIYNLIKEKFNKYAAVIVSALLFALIHMNIYQGSYTFFLGLFMGIIILKTGSLWLTIIFHIVYNISSGLYGSIDPKIFELLITKTYILPIIGLFLAIDSLRFFLIKGGSK